MWSVSTLVALPLATSTIHRLSMLSVNAIALLSGDHFGSK